MRRLVCTVCLLCVFAVATSGQGPIKSPAGLIEIPFRLIDGVIWLQVRVNGSRPLNFPLDTAAGNDVIDRARAVELKLALLEAGIQVGAGTGDGSTRIAVTDNVDLSVGPVSYTNPRIAVVPHDGVSRAYGEQMDGLLGRGFLSRWVVTVDYRQQKLILHPNKTFEYTASGRVLPARFVRGGPVVAGTVVLGEKEYLGEFLIDAPFRRAVALTTPFVQKFGLLEAVRENKQRLLFDELTGVAGKSRSWMGRATAFRIAGTTIPQPITEFTQATGGSMASQEMSGIVGYEVLRYFRITFDFHHMNVIFEKSTEPKPGDADMAGIVWDCDPPDFVPLKVIRIRDDSPASEAGILVGDVLVSIDGLPASGLRKWKVAELLKRPGAQVAMVVNRGGTKIRAKFTLRCLL